MKVPSREDAAVCVCMCLSGLLMLTRAAIDSVVSDISCLVGSTHYDVLSRGMLGEHPKLEEIASNEHGWNGMRPRWARSPSPNNSSPLCLNTKMFSFIPILFQMDRFALINKIQLPGPCSSHFLSLSCSHECLSCGSCNLQDLADLRHNKESARLNTNQA